MALPSAAEMTNLYLYESTSAPGNKADEALIRLPGEWANNKH